MPSFAAPFAEIVAHNLCVRQSVSPRILRRIETLFSARPCKHRGGQANSVGSITGISARARPGCRGSGEPMTRRAPIPLRSDKRRGNSSLSTARQTSGITGLSTFVPNQTFRPSSGKCSSSFERRRRPTKPLNLGQRTDIAAGRTRPAQAVRTHAPAGSSWFGRSLRFAPIANPVDAQPAEEGSKRKTRKEPQTGANAPSGLAGRRPRPKRAVCAAAPDRAGMPKRHETFAPVCGSLRYSRLKPSLLPTPTHKAPPAAFRAPPPNTPARNRRRGKRFTIC